RPPTDLEASRATAAVLLPKLRQELIRATVTGNHWPPAFQRSRERERGWREADCRSQPYWQAYGKCQGEKSAHGQTAGKCPVAGLALPERSSPPNRRPTQPRP